MKNDSKLDEFDTTLIAIVIVIVIAFIILKITGVE